MILNFFPGGGGGASKDISEAVVTLGTALEYTGAVQTQTVASVALNGVTLTEGTDYVVIGNTGSNAGSYSLTVLGFGAYSGYVAATWTISKKSIAKPTISGTSYTYDGNSHGPTITGFDSTWMSKSGDENATNAGSYSLTVSLADATNTKWSDDSTAAIVTAWSVAVRSITKPTISGTSFTYNGSTQGPTITGFDSTWMAKSDDTATNAGSYTLTIGLSDTTNTEWSDHTTAAITQAWTISKATPTVTAPTANTLTYTGQAQALVTAGSTTGGELQYSLDGLNYSTSIPTGTGAGSYTVYYKVVGGTNYNDVAAATVSVSISKAQGSISASPSSLSISGAVGATGTAALTVVGDGTLSVGTSASGVATASVSGTTVTVTAVAEGTATITVTMADGDNYLGASCTISVDVAIVTVFGVMWNYSNSSTALTRLTPATDPNGYVTDSVSSEPSPAVGTGSGSSPFDSYAPWKDMDEYNVASNAISKRKGESGFSRSSDTVVYIPAFYFKIVNDTAHSKMYFYVSNKAVTGFSLHPGSNSYVGRYHTSLTSNVYYSVTGKAAANNMTRATARSTSHSKGTKWWQWGVAQWMAIQLLYLIEFADFNSQSKIGNGRAYSSGTAQNSGGTDSMTYHTGRASGTENQQAVQYRHIENLWGNYSNWLDGINFSDRKAYVCTDPSKFADDTSSNYTDAGITLPSSNYITGLGVSSACPWLMLPNAASNGSETTYVSDYVYSNTGWRVAFVAGSYSASAPGDYGLFCLYGFSDSSSSYSTRGSRLLFKP